MTLAPARTLGTPGIDRFTPAQLLRTARLFASDPALATLLDPASGPPAVGRARLHRLPAGVADRAGPPARTPGWHDHGDAAGAFVTVQGTLQEQTWSGGRLQERDLDAGRRPRLRRPARAPRRQRRPGRPRCRSTSTHHG